MLAVLHSASDMPVELLTLLSSFGVGCFVCSVVDRVTHAGLARAVRATIDCIARFNAVANDTAAAMCATRCEFFYRTFKAVKRETLTSGGENFERRGVIVAAYFTTSHAILPSTFNTGSASTMPVRREPAARENC